MTQGKILQRTLFDQLPPEWPDDLLPAIQDRIRASRRKVVVLDDDPTGTQTVHGIPVLTEWPVDQLQAVLTEDWPVVYLLTNSRSLSQQQAQLLSTEIAAVLESSRSQTGQDFAVVSRSDSTLRGHFPAEVQALSQGLKENFDAWLIIPFFTEGGRFTAGDVHYVAEGEWLVPAGETEFARDKAFGYRASNLLEWVAEKTNGAVSKNLIASISLETIRRGGPEEVTRQLTALPQGSMCIVNALSYRDLEVFVLGLLDAEAQGKRYLYRTAASFVRVRAGVAPRALLTRAELQMETQGAGLIIAGSYVPKTSMQIETLRREPRIHAVEIDVQRLLDEASRSAEIARALAEVNLAMTRDGDTILYTSRQLISTESAEGSLAIGQVVSDSLVSIVRGLHQRPRYLLAKGGITSSDTATRGLGVARVGFEPTTNGL
jgi:uncharacterized protein YgbK (DUF1537 family)